MTAESDERIVTLRDVVISLPGGKEAMQEAERRYRHLLRGGCRVCNLPGGILTWWIRDRHLHKEGRRKDG